MAQSATMTLPTDQKNDSEMQTSSLATTFEELLGSDNAPEENADDMIQAVRQWRDTQSGRRNADGPHH